MFLTDETRATLRALLDGQHITNARRGLARAELHSIPTANLPDDPSEMDFRVRVPAGIGDSCILQVSHYRPNDGFGCPDALAVTMDMWGTGGEKSFATHRLVYRRETRAWLLLDGHQGLTRAEAEIDIRVRAEQRGE